MDYPHVPAAFINAIADEGSKHEAILWLQRTWDELCYVREQLETLTREQSRNERSGAQSSAVVQPPEG